MSARICFILLSESRCSAGAAEFSPALLDSMQHKQTYIAHGEAFAPLFALFHEGDFLKGKSVMWFIDNLGVLSCFCKGSSVVADVGCIVHAVLLHQAALKVQAWYEHVDSKANIADGGTRFSTEITDALGISLKQLSLPPWPANTLTAPPSEWISWFQLK